MSYLLTQELKIPELRHQDLSSIQVQTDKGLVPQIKPSRREHNFTVVFDKDLAGKIVTLQFLKMGDQSQQEVKAKKTLSLPVQIKPEKKEKPKKKGVFSLLQKKQIERKELKQARIDEIRHKNISHPDLKGQRILTFDYTGCWSRSLGMIQKAVQLEAALKIPLHQYYDIITGQGDGAIIAAAVAANISFDRLAEWWTNDWKKVHSPNILQKSGRMIVSKVKPNISGYSAGKARKALKKLFSKASGASMRMQDTLTKLQITVIQADMNIHTHYSDKTPDMELWAVVEDTAITKIHYSQGETIKGEAVFLGAIEKNDVLGLALSENNHDMSITSIGIPTRIHPQTARQLTKAGHAADKVALQNAGHFVDEKRIIQLIKKLNKEGNRIQYHRLECKALDDIVRNSTDDRAMQAGLDSGSGQIFNIWRGDLDGNKRVD